LLEKSKNLELNLREIWSYYPQMKKCSIKIYSDEDLVSSPKKCKLGGLMLWQFLYYACKTIKFALKIKESGTEYQGILVLLPSDEKK
jgi:hypothetical protein